MDLCQHSRLRDQAPSYKTFFMFNSAGIFIFIRREIFMLGYV